MGYIFILFHSFFLNFKKEIHMTKEIKHRRKEDKKKPTLSLKERRAKKQEKRQHKQEHNIDETFHVTE
jgi:hypothetical protein